MLIIIQKMIFYIIFLFFAAAVAATPLPKCVNCKFFVPHPQIGDNKMGLCSLFEFPPDPPAITMENAYDAVAAAPQKKYMSCIRARHFTYMCGNRAKYFEPKEQSIVNPL
jgi:hypothetical protein